MHFKNGIVDWSSSKLSSKQKQAISRALDAVYQRTPSTSVMRVKLYCEQNKYRVRCSVADSMFRFSFACEDESFEHLIAKFSAHANREIEVWRKKRFQLANVMQAGFPLQANSA